MKIHLCEQKSEEWHKLRLQYPLTASNAYAIANNGKGLESLCWEKMAEKYSSAPRDTYTSKDLDRGNELEAHALSLYELETDTKVEIVGFITNDKISKVCGASPDGIIGKQGLLEIKSFADAKHLKMVVDLKNKGNFEIEDKHLMQMQMQMLVADRKWVDFVAFNPNLKRSLLIKRILPDKEMQSKIKKGLEIGEKIIRDIEKNLK